MVVCLYDCLYLLEFFGRNVIGEVFWFSFLAFIFFSSSSYSSLFVSFIGTIAGESLLNMSENCIADGSA